MDGNESNQSNPLINNPFAPLVAINYMVDVRFTP